MSNNRLKFFIRQDAAGRLIPGTGVYRYKQPSVGSWREVEPTACCGPATTVTATPGATSGSGWVVNINCASGNIELFFNDLTATDIADLAHQLNIFAGYLGIFSVALNGTDIDLALKLDIAQNLCGENAITMTIVLD